MNKHANKPEGRRWIKPLILLVILFILIILSIVANHSNDASLKETKVIRDENPNHNSDAVNTKGNMQVATAVNGTSDMLNSLSTLMPTMIVIMSIVILLTIAIMMFR